MIAVVFLPRAEGRAECMGGTGMQETAQMHYAFISK